MAETYVLAADLGGTNLRTAAVNADGSILHQRQTKTPRSATAAEIAELISAESRACTAEIDGSPGAFGIAAAALVDSRGQCVLSAPNLHQLDGFQLAAEVETRVGFCVLLENDATAAAIGERWLGASKSVASSICVTLGTGVGGGLILDGRPYRGATGTAGEIGHICVEPEGVQCGCGSSGCLEQYASATAIVRMAGEFLRQNHGSRLTNSADLTSKEIYEAGIGGDPVGIETFRRMGAYLGIALSDLINVLNPNMIVIGGGAAAGWDLFIDPLLAEIDRRAFEHPAKTVEIVRASLGNKAGILGAARVAIDFTEGVCRTEDSLS